MMEIEQLNTTYNQLIKFLDEYKPNLSAEEKHLQAIDEIDKNGGLEYYVHIFGCHEMKDISPHARVKTPVKYFKKYEAAKIFQLRNILAAQKETVVQDIRLHQFTDDEIQSMKKQYKELSEKYPEYII